MCEHVFPHCYCPYLPAIRQVVPTLNMLLIDFSMRQLCGILLETKW